MVSQSKVVGDCGSGLASVRPDRMANGTMESRMVVRTDNGCGLW